MMEIGFLNETGHVSWFTSTAAITFWAQPTHSMSSCFHHGKVWVMGGFHGVGGHPDDDAIKGSNSTWSIDPQAVMEVLEKTHDLHLEAERLT